jgi:hypothetical protein
MAHHTHKYIIQCPFYHIPEQLSQDVLADASFLSDKAVMLWDTIKRTPYVCNVRMYVCMYECMYVGMYVCRYYICTYVCMYVHMYVCMYVCMCV